MTEQEFRITSSLVELRADMPGRAIGGYAAQFNRNSSDLGGFVERVAPTFFNKTRADGWPGLGDGVIARYNHDNNLILGRTTSGTLALDVDGEGLRYRVEVPESRADVYELVQRGDIRQSSFAFITVDDEWDKTEQNYPMRTLLEGKLVDVSPVVTPAYPTTTVALASLARRFSAPIEEVRKMAAENELRKFFVRSDGPSSNVPMSGAMALAEALAKPTLDDLI